MSEEEWAKFSINKRAKYADNIVRVFVVKRLMESPGKHLKRERELRNLSLEEVTKFTCIKDHFLKAIEEDEHERWPAPVYVKGYLAIYARYLGIDPKDVILQYQNYLQSLLPPPPPELEQQQPAPKKSVRPWLLLIFLFPMIGFIALFTYLITKRPVESVRPALVKEESAPTPVSPNPTLVPIQGARIQVKDQAEQKDISRPEQAEKKETVGAEVPPQILEAGMGTGVENEGGRLVLKGKSFAFECNNQKAYFFTRVKTQTEGKVTHVWLWKGKEFSRREMEINPPAWSIYSYLTLKEQHAGNWKVEARDGDHVLASISFDAAEPASYSVQE